MPSPDERERMDRLEDLRHPALEATGLATLALVAPGENLREWTYDTRSEARFLETLNRILAREPAFPIRIHVTPDAPSKTCATFRAGVQEQGRAGPP